MDTIKSFFLSYMCGGSTGTRATAVDSTVLSPGLSAQLSIQDRAELPVLIEPRIDGSFVEFWLRNPRAEPSRETSIYYQLTYRERGNYEIVDGYVDVGGSTETRQRVRVNYRRVYPSIPKDIEVELGQVRVLPSRYNP
ncbi:MAG: hypothetical protein AAF959_22620 [Cyanobacteria bacterium P01_D01_bin.56]